MAHRTIAVALAILAAACDSPDVSEQKLGQFAAPLPVDPAACLRLGPELDDFGTIGRGCTARRTARLENLCTDPVTLTAIRLNGPPAFKLTQTPPIPVSGLVIDPGTSLIVGAGFFPMDATESSGQLELEVSAGDARATRSFALRGSGAAVETMTDELDFGLRPNRADVLFVVDNAPGFEQHLPSVRANLASFARYAKHTADDLHFAFTTTAGSGGAGRAALLASPSGTTIFDVAAPDFETEFSALLASLTTGASMRDPVAAAVEALEAADVGGPNEGLVRPGANTSVIFISNGPDLSPLPIRDHLNRLRMAAGAFRRPWAFTANVIAPFALDECAEGGDDGRFAFLVGETNGVRDSLCTPDWSKTFEQLGKLAFGFRARAYLSRHPNLTRGTPMSLTIDGVDVPMIDNRGATVWTYDAELQAIVMELMYVPAPSEVVRATYALDCPVPQ